MLAWQPLREHARLGLVQACGAGSASAPKTIDVHNAAQHIILLLEKRAINLPITAASYTCSLHTRAASVLSFKTKNCSTSKTT